MSEKQRLLNAVAGLPESMNWSRVTDAVLNHLAVHGTPAEYAHFYASQLTAENLAEYEAMKPEHDLGDILAEVEVMYDQRASA